MHIASTSVASRSAEVDGDLGGEDVQADLGPAAAAKDDLGGKEIRSVLLVAALDWGNGHRGRLGSLPVCLSVSVPLRGQRN
jgi:hypothetical protein